MTSPYEARRRRAIALLGTAVAAEELLGFLIGLMELQASVHRWAIEHFAGAEGVPPASSGVPRLDLGRLDPMPMVPELRRMVAGTLPIANDVLAKAGGTISVAPPGALQEALRGILLRESVAKSASAVGMAEVPLGFFARAFLQPVVEALRLGGAEPRTDHPGGESGRSCPACGHPPLLSILRDEDVKQNARYLCCSLCTDEWAFPRLTCPLCGEAESKALLHHTSDTLPHIRVDECRSCRSYLKAIDLRKAGAAVPIIDEVAAVELDLWAQQRNLRKGQLNLLGF